MLVLVCSSVTVVTGEASTVTLKVDGLKVGPYRWYSPTPRPAGGKVTASLAHHQTYEGWDGHNSPQTDQVWVEQLKVRPRGQE